VNELFGLSMTYIMIALLVLLAVALSSVAWVALRNRVMFFIGLRNIPRRRAQTVLIVLGLMLSTLIISTAFSIGDTVDYSVTNQAYDTLHSVDETVQTQAGDSGGDFEGSSLVSARPIPEAKALELGDTFRAIPGVDGAVSVIRGPVPVSNARAGQTEPVVVLAGVDARHLASFESDFESVSGGSVRLSDLGPDELYANKSAADKLDIAKGDALQIFIEGQPRTLTVRDIVKDRALTGTSFSVPAGLVTTLAAAQALFNRPGEVDFIAVSNDGGVRDGINNSKRIKDALNSKLQDTPYRATTTKRSLVDAANLLASFLTTFFVVLGLFSIAAGMMLIFLIFVMLAAERKAEMGMIRAVGTKRRHLVQIFLSEGMAYNVGAAAVGCALGIAVSLVMVRIMAALFAGFNLSVVFHVSARSLIVSYSLGVVLTFLTVTFSSWRVGALNIVSAIRDTPEPAPERMRPGAVRGVRSLLSFVRWLIWKPAGWRQWLSSVGMLLVVPAFGAATAGLFIAAFGVYDTFPASGAVSVLLGVGGGVAAVLAVVIAGFALNRIFQAGAMAAAIGALLVIVGVGFASAAPYSSGISLLILGAALSLTMIGLPQRPVFTTMGLVLLVYWLLGAGGHIPPNYDGGIEMFFISGVVMVLAATFVLIYNADLMLAVLTRAGSAAFSTLVPSIRTAVAYPLANKFRTGMTVAMISLVMFALVMISTMNSNFSRIFLSKDAEGGYQVSVTESPNNHIADLPAALQAQGVDTSGIAGVDDVRWANSRVSEVRVKAKPGEADNTYERYGTAGPSAGFLAGNGVKLQARAEGYASDADVWRALASTPNLAVIPEFALGGGGNRGDGFSVSEIKDADKTFKPVTIQVRDGSIPASVRDVQIIGVIATKASLLYEGLFLSPQTFDALYPRPAATVHLVKLNPGVDATAEARTIEKALLAQGVQADSLRKVIDDAQAQQRGFLYLIQGFMGIGLFVGIAAVGVIAFRTVVERRQQIGMLRAIGYTRRAVAISFIMESSFIALLGILSGIALAILLANQLLTSADFASNQIESFYVPWLQIVAIGAFAFVASLVMTIIPSRQASGIPIAEALRYE